MSKRVNAVASVVNAVSDAARQAAEARAQYPDLIRRAAEDRSEPGDAELLQRAMAAMELSVADVESDVQSVRNLAAEQRKLAELRERQPALDRAMVSANEKLELERKAWTERERELLAAAQTAGGAANAGSRAESDTRERIRLIKGRASRIWPVEAKPAPRPVAFSAERVTTPEKSNPEPTPPQPEPALFDAKAAANDRACQRDKVIREHLAENQKRAGVVVVPAGQA